jgi:hypothetical protein
MAELTDQQKADALRKQQRGARADRALNMAETTAKVGGRAMQAEGAIAETMGKVGKPIARGTQKGGESMVEAGGELSTTGVGAIAGVPLIILGTGVTGVGVVGQGLAEGAEKQGQAARQFGGQVVRGADNLKKSRSSFGGRRQSGGLTSSFGGRRRKYEEDTRSVLGSMRHRARQNMSPAMAKAEQGVVYLMGAPVRMATSEALKQSWIHLISSWGATSIYINLHAFGRLTVGSDWFCKLGHEWGGGIAKASPASAGQAGQEIMKKVGDRIGIVESMGLGVLDLIILIAMFIIVAIISLIYYAISFPATEIGKLLAALF